MLTDISGKELDAQPRGLKVRLSALFRITGQTMSEFMAELKLLTAQDETDFRGWLNSAGYPTT